MTAAAFARNFDPLAGRVAIYDGQLLHIVEHDGGAPVATLGLTPAQLPNIGALQPIIARYAIRSLWLLGNHRLPTAAAPWWTHETVKFLPVSDQAAPMAASVQRGATASQCVIADLNRDARWPMGAPDGQIALFPSVQGLIGIIAGIEGQIGIPLAWSPATTGLALMRATTKHTKAANMPDALPSIATGAIHWRRPLNRSEYSKGYWHYYDVNAAYVSAAGSTPLGAYRPLEAHWSAADEKGKRAAIWAVHCPVPGDVIRHDGWYDTAVVRAQMQSDPTVIKVAHGLAWEESHYCLRGWSDKLWAARRDQEFRRSAAGVATVKAIYTQSFGSLGSEDRPQSYRPHWHRAILGESTRRVWKTAGEVAALAVEIDMLVIPSHSPDPRDPQHTPAAILARPGGLGAFKHSYTAAPPTALRDDAAKGRLSSANIVKYGRESMVIPNGR